MRAHCRTFIRNASGGSTLTGYVMALDERPAMAALFAAFLGNIPVTVENMPERYLDLARCGDDTLPQAMLPFDILKLCDLDELVNLTQARVIDPGKEERN